MVVRCTPSQGDKKKCTDNGPCEILGNNVPPLWPSLGQPQVFTIFFFTTLFASVCPEKNTLIKFRLIAITLVFHWFPFVGCSFHWFPLLGFHGFSLVFHGFSLGFHGFSIGFSVVSIPFPLGFTGFPLLPVAFGLASTSPQGPTRPAERRAGGAAGEVRGGHRGTQGTEPHGEAWEPKERRPVPAPSGWGVF